MCNYSDFEDEYENDRRDVSALDSSDDWYPEVEESGTPDGADEMAELEALFSDLGLDDFDDDFRHLDESNPFGSDVEGDMLARAQQGVEIAQDLIGDDIEAINLKLAEHFQSGGTAEKADAMLAAHMASVYFGAIIYTLTNNSEGELDAIASDIRQAASQL